MGWIKRRIARALQLEPRAGSVLVPPRTSSRRGGPYGIGDAVTLPAVYRALDILATAAGQLPIIAERNGAALTDETPAVVRRPSLEMTRSEWISALVLDMATNGDAALLATRNPAGGVVALEPVPSAAVHVEKDKHGNLWGHYDSTRYRISGTQPAMILLSKLRLPGRIRGLGPIQASMSTVTGALDMRDYVSQWWQGSGQPSGILTSDQMLNGEDAQQYIRAWNQLGADGQPDLERIRENPAGIKVLGKGLTYKPLLLNPADAMWIQAQEFSALDIARLFGVPTSLMLTAPSGGTNTYSNVEQDWLAFTRFTLAGYLRPIEEALSAALVRGQSARFNIDALLRSDRKTRFEGHKLALDAGWITIDEIRAIEGLKPKGDLTA